MGRWYTNIWHLTEHSTYRKRRLTNQKTALLSRVTNLCANSPLMLIPVVTINSYIVIWYLFLLYFLLDTVAKFRQYNGFIRINRPNWFKTFLPYCEKFTFSTYCLVHILHFLVHSSSQVIVVRRRVTRNRWLIRVLIQFITRATLKASSYLKLLTCLKSIFQKCTYFTPNELSYTLYSGAL